MNNGMIFYKSFQKAIKTLPKREQLKALWAIIDYALDGVEPENLGSAECAFILAKPQIDANNKRRENGKKGGRPKGDGYEKAKPNDNQDVTKDEPKVKEKVKEKVKVKEKEKVKEKDAHGEYGNVLLTDDELNKLQTEYGTDKTDDAIKFFDEYIEEKGYKAKSHYLAIRRWVFDAVEEKKNRGNPKSKPKKTGFSNAPERDYDFAELEKAYFGSE